MKTTAIGLLSAALLVSLPSLLRAQNFDCGSDGSYGPLNVTSNTTLALPVDGIFKCTTIFIGTNATLTFTRNALNTPVYLLATGNVTINGTMDVSGGSGTSIVGGTGGPGGFDGGNPGGGVNVAAAGFGPGAGQANGHGGYGTSFSGAPHGPTYGSPLLVPTVGGSGGGGITGSGGDGGGGAVLVASNVRIDVSGTGKLLANGGSDNVCRGTHHGSGGGIRLVAPVVAGTGLIQVLGGTDPCYGSAGSGRIRIDAIDKRSALFTYGGPVSGGASMFVFPSPLPRLDIVEAAGTLIPLGNPSAVSFQLPFGSTSNRTVTVRAQDFNAAVPISVVLTPDQGNSIIFTNTIDNLSSNPATNIVNVVVPVNVVVKVNAWTR